MTVRGLGAGFLYRTAAVPLLGLLALCTVPDLVEAQEQVVIRGDHPHCPDCLLRFDEIGRIGGVSDTLGLVAMDASRMQLIGGDRVVVSPSLVPYVVAVYDLSGGQPRTLGREGRGPGEFQRIWAAAVDPQERFRVYADGRETVLSETGGVLDVRSAPGRPVEVLLLPWGGYVLHGFVPTRDRAGYPLHIVGDDGEVQRSFGKVGRGPEFDGFSFRRNLATSGAGRFWAAHVNEYRLVQWDTAGGARREVLRAPSWFQPWTEWVAPWEGRPPPRLADIYEDSLGRLWTMTWIADDGFRRIPVDEIDIRGVEGAGDHPLYDTIIEVLDVDSGKLVVSRRFGRMYSGFYEGGVIGAWDATPAGYQLFTFYRLNIEVAPR